jgi:hypothetical protein
MKIKPQQRNLLIQLRTLDKPDELISIPDVVDIQGVSKYPYGEVIDVGPECILGFDVGAKVLFLANNAIGFELNDQIVYIIPETCVLATYELTNGDRE